MPVDLAFEYNDIIIKLAAVELFVFPA